MEGDLQRTVGRSLRRHRQARGPSQEAFAHLVGVHRTYVGGLERGERNLTLRSLERIAAMIDVDPWSCCRSSGRRRRSRGCNDLAMTSLVAPLLRPAGPAQSEWLVHFCGRPPGTAISGNVPSHITSMTPDQRLDNILWDQQLYAFVPFGGIRPMICLAECTWDHLRWLITERGFPPWAVMLSRQWAYSLGAGPVWYIRPAQYAAISYDERSWAVKLDTTAPSDWLHEREWRVPVSDGYPAVSIASGAVGAVIVGDPQWRPSVRIASQEPTYWISGQTGQLTGADDPFAVGQAPTPVIAYHPFWDRVPFYCWNPATYRFDELMRGTK
jgi:transcriptional regulator with XRE-family HTH domain